MKANHLFILTIFSTLLLSSCSSTTDTNTSQPKQLSSYLMTEQQESTVEVMDEEHTNEVTQKKANGMIYIPSLATQDNVKNTIEDLTQQFSDTKTVQITADDLPLKDYLHYVMGEQLGVSYILGEQVKNDTKSVTLNIQHQVTERKLFSLSEEILVERGYVIRFDEDIYYIHKLEGNNTQGNVAYGYGKSFDSVPATSASIVQLVPFTFGMQTSIASALRQIVNIKTTADYARNALILQGKRKEIIRALEFIQLMDQPAFKNRYIAVYKGDYVSTQELIDNLPKLLKQEGISVGTAGLTDKAVSIVPLESIGTIVLFANSKLVLERVEFWTKQIDQPPSGTQLQYFVYQPRFARATDLGSSIQALFGGTSSGVGTSTSAASQNNTTKTKNTNSKSTVGGVLDGKTRLVVDQRANSLIFSTTGNKYRQLLPLVKRLDVMPKQVILEVMIAEVKLTDVFKQGVEFALTNQGNASLVGGFDFSSGSAGLSYLLTGAQGHISYSLLQTNNNVNVLSRPSLLVRDGVTASIIIGEEIPTVGEIVSDPNNGNRTSVIYRKTGVDLKVTPTINGQGVVIMEIQQNITNQVPADDSVAGSPIFFERSISTEVVAESGQTIILGGLISETRTINDRSVPFFSSIPLFGKLFDATTDTADKTELVVLVTPRVIESTNEWNVIKAKFVQGLSKLNFDQ